LKEQYKMASKDPIPEDIRQAFHLAIGDGWGFENWHSGGSPIQILLGLKTVPIEVICDLASIYSDPMPEGIFNRLNKVVAHYYIEPPEDQTYENGARSLRALCDKLRKRDRERDIPT
jgi:hypothetical protein